MAAASDDVLEAWLTQRTRDAFGTWSHLLRAIAWCRRGDLTRTQRDVAAALAKQPAYELTELVAALILYVARDHGRALSLLFDVAARHPYLAAQTLQAAATRATRLGWVEDQREARTRLRALGVRDLGAHVERLRAANVESLGAGDDRARAEVVFERLPILGSKRARALLDALPNARSVRARLALREGDLDEAEAWLDDRDEVEAAALALARGDFDRVLALAPTGARGAWLMAEAALELGDRKRARALLTEHAGLPALELLRAEIDVTDPIGGTAAIGGTEPIDPGRLWSLAPGWISDAARGLDREPPAVDAPREVWTAVLRHARAIATADRWAPLPSYRAERLRFVPRQAKAAHREDGRDLDQASALLIRAIERRSSRSRVRSSTASPALSRAELESFAADGFIQLRGAFPRRVAEGVVRDAHARFAEDPGRWLQGGDLGQLGVDMARYDAADPSTWPRGRVDLLGDRRFAFAEFSPRAAAAIAQLLEEVPVSTSSFANNLIVQYPQACPDADWRPEPHWHSWHLDCPKPQTRLSEQRAGLLVLILFSDLEPDSGNTWFAPDSVGHVARALAAAPEGIDFCDIETAPRYTVQCERFHEVTGSAGDILLAHPLLLHTASANPSPRIRWLGNPMIYIDRPLDPVHGRSLVERMIRDAVRSA